jgi:hypothetical protein
VATTKLKAKEIKEYRERLIKKQRGVCPLCKEELLPGDATLDHCHTTGNIRQALHRSCNSAEGRILMWAGRRSRGEDPIEFLKNLIVYWRKSYVANPIHHTHGVPRKRKRKPRMKKIRGTNAH